MPPRSYGDRAVAKGGVVLELRLERARTTRDVDIHLRGSSDGLLAELRGAGKTIAFVVSKVNSVVMRCIV